MRIKNKIRLGFYLSLLILIVDLVIIFWPYISGLYFLRATGFFIGLVGSLFFGIALASHSTETKD